MELSSIARPRREGRSGRHGHAVRAECVIRTCKAVGGLVLMELEENIKKVRE